MRYLADGSEGLLSVYSSRLIVTNSRKHTPPVGLRVVDSDDGALGMFPLHEQYKYMLLMVLSVIGPIQVQDPRSISEIHTRK